MNIKQLLYLIALLITCSIHAQNIVVIPVGSPNQINKYAGGLGMDQQLAIPKGSGAPTTLLFTPFSSKYRAPYIYYDTVNNDLYVYNPYDNAVHKMNFAAIPNLQQVTTAGNTTTLKINALNYDAVHSQILTQFGTSFISHDTVKKNIEIGYKALFAAYGINDLAIGDSALASAANNAFNVAIGNKSMLSLTSGNGNTAIGFRSMPLNTTGSNNIAIGYNATLASSTGDNQLVIGNYFKSSSDGSKLGLYNTNPQYNLDVTGTGAFSGTLKIGSYILPAADGTNGQTLITNGSGVVNWGTIPAGSGTVSSVGLLGPSLMSVSNSPITTSGTINLSWGGTVQGDIPYFNGTNVATVLNKNTTATRYLANTGALNNPQWDQVNLSNGVTGLLPIANGGTGTASPGIVAGSGVTVSGAWPNQTIAATAGAPSLNSTQIGFGNGSNFLTGSSNLTYSGGAVNILASALGSVVNKGLYLENITAATSGTTLQYSPSIELVGHSWNSSSPGNSANSVWDIYNQPISAAYGAGNTAAQGNLIFKHASWGSPAVTISYNGAITAGYLISNDAVQGSYGAFNTVVGAAQISAGTAYGSSTQFFRTTNGGTDLTPQFITTTPNTGAGNIVHIFDRTNGLVFAANNDNVPVRAIMRASIYATDLVNTAGSEAGGIGFATQTGGAAATQKMKLSAAGTLVLFTGTTSTAPLNIPAGLLRSVPASGDIESDGNNLRWTSSAGVSVNLINGKRIQALTSSATVTPNAQTNDAVKITALASAVTFNAPTGTAAPMQDLMIRITDNGTSQALTWNAIYRASSDLPLPGATTAGKTMYVKFSYNNDANTWDLMAVLNNF